MPKVCGTICRAVIWVGFGLALPWGAGAHRMDARRAEEQRGAEQPAGVRIRGARRVEERTLRAAGGVSSAAVDQVLLEMASRADVIFAGRVESVTRLEGAGFVDVRFHIDEGVKGCPRTGAYVLREWAGRWSGRPTRYAVGQRLLMLLNGRGPAGMSGPVDGMDGAIPLLGNGREPLADSLGVAASDDGLEQPEMAVDLRWVETRVMRKTDDGNGAMARGMVAAPVPDGPGQELRAWAGPIAPLRRAGGGTLAGPPSLDSVLMLLRTKREGGHVAR